MRKIIAAILAMVVANTASADPVYTFYRITNNNIEDVGSQLRMTVSDASGGGSSRVAFTFENWVGIRSSICDIYFDDGTLLGIASISDSGISVAFSSPASPGDLPGGNLVMPPFQTSQNFSADSDSPVSDNGINAMGEWVTITFDLLTGATYTQTLAALGDGSLRVGLHVQCIGVRDDSDSYINNPVPIPLPGAALLGVLGLAVAGWARRRM